MNLFYQDLSLWKSILYKGLNFFIIKPRLINIVKDKYNKLSSIVSIFTKLNSGYAWTILNEDLPMPIIIKFYVEHIIILLNLVSDCDLVIIDNYFNNYIFVHINYIPSMFLNKDIFFILGGSTLNLFSQIFYKYFYC